VNVLLTDEISTPIGRVVLVARIQADSPEKDLALCAAEFDDCLDRLHRHMTARFMRYDLRAIQNPGGHSARLIAYFAGDLTAIDDIPVDSGGTVFQQQLWRQLRKIPAGQIRRYGEMAEQLGRPNAPRAVGAANGRNPLSVIIPCHRLIGSNGKLTGYAGGLHRKQWLLEHEGALPREERGPQNL